MGEHAQYWLAVAVVAAIGLTGCVLARRSPDRLAKPVGGVICIVLLADAVVFLGHPLVDHDWSMRTSLPLQLCDVALVIAAVTCAVPRWQLGVELTYFWGLAGTLQAVATPDLSGSFPRLAFFEFVVGHVGIVVAALYLVVGLRRAPRRGAVVRIFAITIGYAACTGIVDVLTGGNYMYLRRVPSHSSLLSELGSWPWYILSTAGVAIALFFVLDLPFRISSFRTSGVAPPRRSTRPPLERRPR